MALHDVEQKEIEAGVGRKRVGMVQHQVPRVVGILVHRRDFLGHAGS